MSPDYGTVGGYGGVNTGRQGTDFIQLIAAGLAVASAAQANRQARKQAEINRQFQAGMANTAHQREVADLRAAGLNPILSGTGGAGAATPSGSVAPATPFDAAGAINSGVAAKRQNKLLQAELDLMKKQEDNVAHDTQVKERQSDLLANQTSEAAWRAIQQSASARMILMDEIVRRQMLPADLDRAVLEAGEMGKWKRRAEMGAGIAAPAASAAKNVLPWLGKGWKGAVGAVGQSARSLSRRIEPRLEQLPQVFRYRRERPVRGTPLD